MILFLAVIAVVVAVVNRTPLHYAATMVHHPCVVSLTTAGAKVNVIDTKGCTPLHYAAASDADAK